MWPSRFRAPPSRRHGCRRPRLVPRLEILEDRSLLSAAPGTTPLLDVLPPPLPSPFALLKDIDAPLYISIASLAVAATALIVAVFR